MPNLVNQILLADLQREFQKMGSCLVVSFDNLQPEQDIAIRGKPPSEKDFLLRASAE